MNQGEIQALQETRFQSVCSHIVATPLHHRKLQQAGIEARSVRGLADLGRLPFTYKEDVRSTGLMERTPLTVDQIFAVYSSGGSSGAPTLYAWSEQDVEVQAEVARRIVAGVGTTSSDLALVLAPLSLPVMGHCMVRQFSAVGAGFVPVGLADPDLVASLLMELPVTVIATLPTVASRLLDYMRFVMHLDLKDKIRVRQLQLGGDFLSEARRQRLEAGWQAQCYDFYGISEIFGPIAGECLCRDGLHLAADYVYLEVLDSMTGLPVAEGEPGVAVYTTLWEKGFPLLRYWSDDYVTCTRAPCRCGLSMPRLRFLGRAQDRVCIGGRLLFARGVEDVILRFPVGNEYECHYAAQDGAACVEVTVEVAPGYAAPCRQIADALEELFGLAVQVQAVQPAALTRDEIKPRRMVGFPTNRC